MHRRVFLTGIGIVTAIGVGVDETLESFYKLKTGIGKLSNFKSVHDQFPVAEIRKSNEELAELAGVSLKNGVYTRNTLLALVAAKQVFQNKDLPGYKDRDTGIVLATTVGGMDLNERFYKSLLSHDTYKDTISVFDSADCTEKVAARFGIRNYVATISTACSSSANAIMLGARLIRNNKLKRVLTGGTDSLTRFTLNGFSGLEILSTTGCRPFDRKRNGLTIGEGAAALMFESEDTADTGSIICEITGYANVNEAYHPTASSPEGYGAQMAMQKAIDLAGLQPADISYINAHGTGTEINDLAEGRAIERLFAGHIPHVSSTKAFTGHTLGAAGAVEAVCACLAIKNQVLVPGLNFSEPMPELSIKPVGMVCDADIHHVLSNSFGFGGNNTTLVFSKT